MCDDKQNIKRKGIRKEMKFNSIMWWQLSHFFLQMKLIFTVKIYIVAVLDYTKLFPLRITFYAKIHTRLCTFKNGSIWKGLITYSLTGRIDGHRGK
jgi:hypothetical protein